MRIDRPGVVSAASNAPEGLNEFATQMVGTEGVQRADAPKKWQGQCVSLVARYIQDLHLPAHERAQGRSFGDGRDVASNVARDFPQRFGACTQSGLPQAGAVISFEGKGPTSSYGHTAVVMQSRLHNGEAQARTLESNQDNRGPKSVVQRSAWLDLKDGLHGSATGWSNPL